MPGFYGYIGSTKLDISQNDNRNLERKSVVDSDFCIEVRKIKKFERDKIFYNDSKHFILTEGVIFNLNELKKEYQVDSYISLLKEMYRTYGDTFFKRIRGSFSGVFYDKINDIFLIYTNHIGDKAVFYSRLPCGNVIFGSEFGYIVEIFSKNNISYSLDLAAA